MTLGPILVSGGAVALPSDQIYTSNNTYVAPSAGDYYVLCMGGGGGGADTGGSGSSGGGGSGGNGANAGDDGADGNGTGGTGIGTLNFSQLSALFADLTASDAGVGQAAANGGGGAGGVYVNTLQGTNPAEGTATSGKGYGAGGGGGFGGGALRDGGNGAGGICMIIGPI